jgi:hypothetical protein
LILGPKNLANKLEDLREKMNFLREKSLKFLEENSKRIDSFHRASVIHSIASDFTLVYIVLSDGETLSGITLSDPFTRSPSPYRINVYIEEIERVVGEIFGWKVYEVKSGVFEFPPKTKFISIVGSDKWIKKEIFQEKLKGIEYLSFAEKMNEEIFEKIRKLTGESLVKHTHFRIDDDGIHLTFFAPEGVKETHIPLLSEMAKVIRTEMKLPVSKYSKIAKKGKVLVVITLPVDFLWKGDPVSIAENFEKRLLDGYEWFLKGAGIR